VTWLPFVRFAIFSSSSPPLLAMILLQFQEIIFVIASIQISWTGNEILCNSYMGCQRIPQHLSSSPTSGTPL